MLSLLDAMPGLTAITVCYALMCAVSPYGRCRRCKGWGAKVRRTRFGRLKRGRECRRCRGYGRRLRVGRRAFNLAHGLYREGTR